MINKMSLAVAVAALLAAGGCTSADKAPPPVDAAGATAAYTRLVEAADGTRDQRIRDEKLVWAELNQSILACMRKAGLDYTVPPFVMTAGGPSDPGDLTSVLPLGLPDFGIAENRESMARATTAGVVPARLTGADEKSGYDDAVDTCTAAAPARDDWDPDGAGELLGKIVDIFSAIEQQPAVQAKLKAYGSCLNQAGYQATTAAALRDTIYAKLPTADVPWATLSASPEWRQAVDYERRAAADDTRCRTDLHDTVMLIGAPQVQKLTADSAATLATIAEQRTARDAVPIPAVGG